MCCVCFFSFKEFVWFRNCQGYKFFFLRKYHVQYHETIVRKQNEFQPVIFVHVWRNFSIFHNAFKIFIFNLPPCYFLRVSLRGLPSFAVFLNVISTLIMVLMKCKLETSCACDVKLIMLRSDAILCYYTV